MSLDSHFNAICQAASSHDSVHRFVCSPMQSLSHQSTCRLCLTNTGVESGFLPTVLSTGMSVVRTASVSSNMRGFEQSPQAMHTFCFSLAAHPFCCKQRNASNLGERHSRCFQEFLP